MVRRAWARADPVRARPEEHHVTQAQLDRAVATATGETVRDIRHRGFGILEHRPASPDPDDLSLVIDCPFCGGVIAYPGLPGDDAPSLAACPTCDVEFEYAPYEVYTAGTTFSRP
jgi:hypothetical protein